MDLDLRLTACKIKCFFTVRHFYRETAAVLRRINNSQLFLK